MLDGSQIEHEWQCNDVTFTVKMIIGCIKKLKKEKWKSKENKNTNSKRYMHPNVHSSIIYNSQVMEVI